MFILSDEEKWMKEKNESADQKTEAFSVRLQFGNKKSIYPFYNHPPPVRREANR